MTAQHSPLVERVRLEIQSIPIHLKPTKQLRSLLKDGYRPVSVYHSEETAREVAEAALVACGMDELLELLDEALTTSAKHWKPKARALLAKLGEAM